MNTIPKVIEFYRKYGPDPLSRAGDIPEVKRLAEAAKEYLVCHTTIFEDALTEALEAFDNGDKGEEPR